MTEKQANAIRQFEELAVRVGSEKKAGQLIGVSSSIISQLRSENYKGDVEKQFERLYTYFETKSKAADTYSEIEYAPTTISEVVYQTLENVKIKGGFAFVTGDAGIGKTKALRKFT